MREDMGCKEISIGSIIITNPKFVEKVVDKYRTI